MFIPFPIFIVGIVLIIIGDIVMAFAYIRSRNQLNELSDAIRETAVECYQVGWDEAVEWAKKELAYKNAMAKRNM